MRPNSVKPKFEEFLVLVEQGLALQDACGQLGLGRTSIFQFIKDRPEQAQRLAQARELSGAGRLSVKPSSIRPRFQEILALVQSGMSLKHATLKLGLQPANAYKFVEAYPDQAAQYRDAVRRSGQRVPGLAFTEQQYDEALRSMEHSNGTVTNGWRVEGLPTFDSMRIRSDRDKGFSLKFEKSRAFNRAKFPFKWNGARDAEVGEQLTTALRQNDLYREASKLFNRNNPDFDDMVTEVIIAVLDGEIRPAEIATEGAEIGWAFVNGRRDRERDSLDAPIGGITGAASLGETITSGDWTFEDAI